MEYYEMPRAEANQTPIDFNASWVRNDFPSRNGRRRGEIAVEGGFMRD